MYILPRKWWAKQISCNISCSSMECYSFILSHQLNKDYVLGDELRGSKINVMSWKLQVFYTNERKNDAAGNKEQYDGYFLHVEIIK